MECKRQPGCLFFNDRMVHLPSLTTVYKKIYCHGDNVGCARNVVAEVLGSENVPNDLFPNELAKGLAILSNQTAEA